MPKRNKTNIETNNDRLIIWQYITGPLFYIIGAIILMGIVIGSINFIWRSDDKVSEKEKEKIVQLRQEQVEKYIDYSSDIIGSIDKKYWDGSIYKIESNKGIFTIRFMDTEILNVELTNKANQTVEIYRGKQP